MLTASAQNRPSQVDQNQSQENTAGTNQSSEPADVRLTQEIRKMIMSDDSLSARAKAVQVMTRDRVVTLRGVVESEKEKNAIEKHAKRAGAKDINNELEVQKT